MRTWFVIADFLALEIYQEEYNESRLAYATEFAADAAFDSALEGVNIGIDYTDLSNIFINNKDVISVFDTVMEFNYNMAVNDTSDVIIEDSISTMALATNDGYYITNLTKVDTGQYRLKWSPKLPYAYTKGSKTYSVNLNSQKWRMVDTNNYKGVISGSKYSDIALNGALSTTIRKETVSTALTDAITQSTDNNNFARHGENFISYIPSIQTRSGINAVYSPTLIVIIHDASYSGVSNTENVTVAGIRAQSAVYVIGYTDATGKKKYSYEWQGAGEVYTVEKLFYSIEEAAKAGYKPDYNYLFNSAVNTFTT